jgi:hypothetical protein
MIKNLILCFAVLLSLPASAQQLLLSGRVTDSKGSPVAFTSVYIKGTTQGASANEDGVYRLRLKPGKYTINYRFVGFKQQTDEVELTDHDDTHNVQLTYEDYQLKPSVAGNTEDPANDIIRHAIQKRAYYLNEINAYSCNVYIQGIQKLISAPKGMLSNGVAHELELDVNHQGVLFLSESESQYNYAGPNKYKEIAVSSKIAGNNNAFNFNRASKLQVNFYKNLFDIEGLNPRGFISPIADNAFNYYTYKLLGSTTENGKVIDKIQVIPKDVRDPAFRGNIYIVENDWRIYDAHLYVTRSANLNLVDTLNINQQYIPVKDDIWQPASVSFTYNGNILGFKYSGYILGVFSDYNLDPKFPPNFFDGETMRITQEVAKRDSGYWAQNRPVPLTAQQQRHYYFRDSIDKKHESRAYADSLEKVNNHFGYVTYVFFGDTIRHREKKEIITLNPLYETVFYNTVEGWAIDLRPTFTKRFDSGREYTISPEVRYGFDNKIVSVNSGFKYKYDPVNQGIFYGKIGSSILDLNSDGTESLFVNSYSSLFFKDNYLKLYRSRYAMAGLQREVARGLLVDGNLEYAKRNALQNTSNRTIGKNDSKEYSSNNPLDPAPDAPLLFQENNALTLKLSATYTFDEEYTDKPDGRFYDPSKYPQITVNYRKGIKSLLGSDVDYDYADVQVFKNHINLGIYGYSSFLVSAGDFFNNNALIYPDYKQFKGNQGLTFEPGIGEFHFLPYYTYSPSAFLEAHYEHNFSGFLFNKIPGLRDLKLEEIVGANYLTQKLNTNYSEFYVGVQRFFFRFDYGYSYQGNGRYAHGIKIYYGL